jgi:prophage regulatory protein
MNLPKLRRPGPEPAPRRLIRLPEVLRRVPYSATTIWRKEKAGQFPRRVQLGPMASAWYEDEIDTWIESRVRQAGKRPAAG